MGGIRVLVVLLAGSTVALAGEAAALEPPGDRDDPAAEARHERPWIEVTPAPEPASLPLLGPEGVDADGYPRQNVDAAALRSLLVNRRFERLTDVVERFQAAFEADARREQWIHDAYDVLGHAHARERELIDAWIAATPRSFAPHLASARYWVNTGFVWRGSEFARDTSTFEFKSMAEAFERARADIGRALALRPGLIVARLFLVVVEVAGGSRALATQAIEDALARCPTCYTVRVKWLWALEPRWGGSFEEMERFAGARVPGGGARHRLLPGFVDLERAMVASAQGMNERSFELLDRACARGKEWEFFLARARARRTSTEYLADLERANAIRPATPAVLEFRAEALAGAERWEEAGRDLLYVLRSRPTSPRGCRLHPTLVRALDSLAWKHYQAGRPQTRRGSTISLAHWRPTTRASRAGALSSGDRSRNQALAPKVDSRRVTLVPSSGSKWWTSPGGPCPAPASCWRQDA